MEAVGQQPTCLFSLSRTWPSNLPCWTPSTASCEEPKTSPVSGRATALPFPSMILYANHLSNIGPVIFNIWQQPFHRQGFPSLFQSSRVRTDGEASPGPHHVQKAA